MKQSLAGFLVASALCVATPLALGAQAIEFAKGATSAQVEGSIQGQKAVDYTVKGRAGQTMSISLKSDNTSAYFNVTPPGANAEPIFIGTRVGTEWSGKLPADGDYAIHVYLAGYAASKNESAKYTMTVSAGGG